jgi:prepilin-type N-terminal cleavage/methylation domain-containing protein
MQPKQINFMGGFQMKIKNNKGFTLIELLIVVAIIAILAAIAIPQFAKYRVRGYNSAADSDLRNTKIAIEAFATDNTAYASTLGCTSLIAACTGGGPGARVLLGGPLSYTITVTAGTINTTPTNVPSADVAMQFGLSNNVTLGISTGTVGANYVAVAAHTAGDTIFASDSALTSLMRAGKDSGGIPTTLAAGVAGYALSYAFSSTGVPATDLDSNFSAM